MKRLFNQLTAVLTAPTGPAPWCRAGATLLLGSLLLAAPETAAKVLTIVLWLPILVPPLLFLRFRKRLSRTEKIILLLIPIMTVVFFCRPLSGLSWHRQALPGAGLWAAVAAVELLIRAGIRQNGWTMRLTGLAGGILSAVAGYALLLKKGGGFYRSSDLLGVFFIALGCLMLAGLSAPQSS